MLVAKKLIFGFDATFQSPALSAHFADDESISNILKLHILLGGRLGDDAAELGSISDQLSFYYSGIGTYGGWARRLLNAAFSPAFLDERHILDKADADLARHYEPGDEIFVFGFSRGAAVARMFVARMDKPVKLVGVFETVTSNMSAFGLDPESSKDSSFLVREAFRDCTLGKCDARAIHLLAIDERRVMLKPTLFNQDSRVTEVWFAGAHGDVGGGYWFDGLSDVTLDFMCREVTASGLELLPLDKIDYQALMPNEGEELQEADYITRDDVAIHPIAYGVLHDARRALRVDDIALEPRVLGVTRENVFSALPEDIPVIHHSVRERFLATPNYRPVPLRNQHYRIMKPNGRVEKRIRWGIEDLRR